MRPRLAADVCLLASGLLLRLDIAALLLFSCCLSFCLYPLAAGLANEPVAPQIEVPLAGILSIVLGIVSAIAPCKPAR